MYSLEYIKAINNKKTETARDNKKSPYIAKYDKDKEVRKSPFLADYLPNGWKIINTYFVDNSGFGADYELALTYSQFLSKVKNGRGYAIKEAGQFQVYINEYARIGK